MDLKNISFPNSKSIIFFDILFNFIPWAISMHFSCVYAKCYIHIFQKILKNTVIYSTLGSNMIIIIANNNIFEEKGCANFWQSSFLTSVFDQTVFFDKLFRLVVIYYLSLFPKKIINACFSCHMQSLFTTQIL